MMLCLLKSCTKCNGDLALEDGHWKCIQCARYYYVEPNNIFKELRAPVLAGLPFPETASRPTVQEDDLSADPEIAGVSHIAPKPAPMSLLRRRRNTRDGRSARNINSYIRAKNLGEARWWDRNRQVVEYLDRGLSVPEISQLTEMGPRQIRMIRERLTDIRAAA